jgi:hypothetical protein
VQGTKLDEHANVSIKKTQGHETHSYGAYFFTSPQGNNYSDYPNIFISFSSPIFTSSFTTSSPIYTSSSIFNFYPISSSIFS